MRPVLLALTVLFSASAALVGQTSRSDGGRRVELVALARPPYLVGAQVEYAGLPYVAPWLSVRYGMHNANCLLLFHSDCGMTGVSALAGLRLKVGPWGPVEPYVTAGVGWVRWTEDDWTPSPWQDRTEKAATIHAGVVWVGLGRFRPRIELGYETEIDPTLSTGINPWVNVGVGLTL